MSESYQITKVDEELKFDAAGKPVEQMRVAFRVGDHGPFYRRYPKEGFNSFTVQQDLEAFARELKALEG